MNNSTTLPSYVCTKTVQAGKIAAIHRKVTALEHQAVPCDLELVTADGSPLGAVAVDVNYMLTKKPQVGGYYVRYADGYESFSPAAPFESGYALLPAEAVNVEVEPFSPPTGTTAGTLPDANTPSQEGVTE